MEEVIQHLGFFYGWVIVATAALGVLLGAFPISVATFRTFFPVYVKDFHLRRSAIGIALLLGRTRTGYFLDRYLAPRVASMVFASSAAGISLIRIGSGQRAVMLIGAFLVGLAFGAEADIIAYWVSCYFGLRSLGIVVVVAFGAFILAGGIGPFVMDLAFDHFASYAPSFAIALTQTLPGAVFLTRLGSYRFGANGDL
jgi:hypothetical protein